jgi:hypothetical protein
VLVEYLIPPKSTATAQGEHVFFDIDVKGGEKVLSGCYSWRSKQNSAAFQGCHQCQRGILLACLQEECACHRWQEQKVEQKARKLRRKSYSGRWITDPKDLQPNTRQPLDHSKWKDRIS